MPSPAPVLRLTGRVYTFEGRDVEPVPARPERRDESGAILARALPARPGYRTHDLVVLTERGGFATAVVSEEAVTKLGGQVPEPGQTVDLPVRPFVKWDRRGDRAFSVVGLSVAAELVEPKSLNVTPLAGSRAG